MIISMVVGAVIGEIIDLDRWITVFGDWVKDKTGNTGDPKFTQAFITASLTFTVGANGRARFHSRWIDRRLPNLATQRNSWMDVNR